MKRLAWNGLTHIISYANVDVSYTISEPVCDVALFIARGRSSGGGGSMFHSVFYKCPCLCR